jgi:hypothetical protein
LAVPRQFGQKNFVSVLKKAPFDDFFYSPRISSTLGHLLARALAKLKLGCIYSILEYPLALGYAALFNIQPAVAYHGPGRAVLSNVQPCGCSSWPLLAPNPLCGFFANPPLFSRRIRLNVVDSNQSLFTKPLTAQNFIRGGSNTPFLWGGSIPSQ